MKKSPPDVLGGGRELLRDVLLTPYPGTETPNAVVCAWCEDILEDGPGPVSHAMCPTCHAAFMATLPEE